MATTAPDPGCPFCEIIEGEVEAHVVYADTEVVAFLDRSPLFHGHTLVVPRQHVVTLADLDEARVGPFFRRVQHISRELPINLGVEGSFVANNNVVSQSVAHLHVHVVPRRRGDGLRGFFWPRTKYADGEAEAMASRLRAGFEHFTD
jgi:histidine triad (HIT) family protein